MSLDAKCGQYYSILKLNKNFKMMNLGADIRKQRIKTLTKYLKILIGRLTLLMSAKSGVKLSSKCNIYFSSL